MFKLAANLSFLFPERDFVDRFAAAAGAGFRDVEVMFPCAFPTDRIATALRDAGVELVLFNLPAGDWAAGERGIASDPRRVDECRAGVGLAVATARQLGCRRLNCLAGLDGATQDACYADNLRYAADACALAGITLLVEAIDSRIDMPGFRIDTPQRALAAIAAAGRGTIALQFDVYHAQVMGGDASAQLRRCLPWVGHVQIADHPGRYEQGSGGIDWPALRAALADGDYAEWVGCEYRPAGDTAARRRPGERAGVRPKWGGSAMRTNRIAGGGRRRRC